MKILKASVVLPFFLGLFLAFVFSCLGLTQDAPGACVIGLGIGYFCLLLCGVNSGLLKTSLFAPVLLLSYALGIIVLNTAILLDGEYESSPQFSLIGYGLGVVLAVVGLHFLRRKNGKDN
jgi:peptidoglycan/LPS O-acetylase OafA/YrhL